MLSADNLVWVNWGGVDTTSPSVPITVTAAPGYTTTADNAVFVMFFLTDPAGSMPVFDNWTQLAENGRLSSHVRGYGDLEDGESSWDFVPESVGAGGPAFWIALELSNVEGAEIGVLDNSVLLTSTSGSTVSANTGQTTSYDSLYLAALCAHRASSGTPATWSGLTADAQQIAAPSYSSGSKSFGAIVAVRGGITAPVAVQSIGATQSGTFTSSDVGGRIGLLINAKDARREPVIYDIDGAEHGTIVGNTQGVAGLKILETVTAGVSVSAAAARSGNYGWLLSASSAACNLTRAMFTGVAVPPVHRRHFRFPTLPAANTELWVLTTTGGTNIVVRYITASQKLGLKVGTGGEVVSDQTVTANQWFGVDLSVDLRGAPGFLKVRWAVDYNAELSDTTAGVLQTYASGPGSGTSLATNGYRVGWTAATTATMHSDDAAAAGTYPHFPLGDIRVLPVTVDPAATPTVFASAANFGTMLDDAVTGLTDGTLANARDAVDDVPPTLGFGRDAAVCIGVSGTDYLQFPMAAPNLADLGVNVRGVRALASFWAATSTAATIRLSVFDGVTSWDVFPEADPGADNTATPVWFARMLRGTSAASFSFRVFWNQEKLDALAYRMGSNDANPNIGVDMLLLEVAVRKASAEVLFGEPGSVYIEAARDPDTAGLVGFTVNTPSGEPCAVDYEVDGVPFSTGVVTGGSSEYVPIAADGTLATINRITLSPG